MNTDYLLSIINLYLKKENDKKKTNLNIHKLEQVIIFSFNMSKKESDKTSCTISIEEIDGKISKILNIYKEDEMIIDEKYSNKKDNCHYEVLFKNGRILSFDGFNSVEINSIRNILFNISVSNNVIQLEELNEEKKMVYHPTFSLQQAGFASNTTLFLVALYVLDAFLIALLIFKELTK